MTKNPVAPWNLSGKIQGLEGTSSHLFSLKRQWHWMGWGGPWGTCCGMTVAMVTVAATGPSRLGDGDHRSRRDDM